VDPIVALYTLDESILAVLFYLKSPHPYI